MQFLKFINQVAKPLVIAQSRDHPILTLSVDKGETLKQNGRIILYWIGPSGVCFVYRKYTINEKVIEKYAQIGEIRR